MPDMIDLVCVDCIHKEVCKYESDFKKFCSAIAKANDNARLAIVGLDCTVRIDCGRFQRSRPIVRNLR